MRQVFRLARDLKAKHPEKDPADLWPLVRAHFAHVSDEDFEAIFAELVYAWPRVRHPAGQGPLVDAIKAARSRLLPPAIERLRSRVARELLALCLELADRDPPNGYPPGHFCLAQQPVAEVLGSSWQWPTVRNLLRSLLYSLRRRWPDTWVRAARLCVSGGPRAKGHLWNWGIRIRGASPTLGNRSRAANHCARDRRQRAERRRGRASP